MNALFNVGATSRSRPGQIITAVIALLLCSLSCRHNKSEVDPRLKLFAAQKHKQAQELADSLGVKLQPELRRFFAAAEKGDLQLIEKQWEKIWPRTGWWTPNTVSEPAYENCVWIPAHETFYAYDQFMKWDSALLQRFADGILGKLPAGAIYFGGTDAGRFLITAVSDTAGRTDIYGITQNALADHRYMEYLRRIYGSRIWLPSDGEAQQAFNQYAEDLQAREPVLGEKIDFINGRVSVQGVASVMAVGGILSKMIFDRNKDRHTFYVEESYVVPWMYPHMVPDGLIFKLTSSPADSLQSEIVKRDRQFWDQLCSELPQNPAWQECYTARLMFAKLRSAIGGVYGFRRMIAESEYALKQAVDLCRESPEANFRLAQLYVDSGRFDDAIDLLKRYAPLDRPDLNRKHSDNSKQQVRIAISCIEEMKQKAGKAEK